MVAYTRSLIYSPLQFTPLTLHPSIDYTPLIFFQESFIFVAHSSTPFSFFFCCVFFFLAYFSYRRVFSTLREYAPHLKNIPTTYSFTYMQKFSISYLFLAYMRTPECSLRFLPSSRKFSYFFFFSASFSSFFFTFFAFFLAFQQVFTRENELAKFGIGLGTFFISMRFYDVQMKSFLCILLYVVSSFGLASQYQCIVLFETKQNSRYNFLP